MDETRAEPAPAALRWAVGLLLGEAVAVALVAAWLLFEDLTGAARNLAGALALTGFAALVAVALAGLARALARRRSGARAPVIVLQLMLLPIGYYMTIGGLAWLGVPLVVLGLVVCGLVVSPSSTQALGLDQPSIRG